MNTPTYNFNPKENDPFKKILVDKRLTLSEGFRIYFDYKNMQVYLNLELFLYWFKNNDKIINIYNALKIFA